MTRSSAPTVAKLTAKNITQSVSFRYKLRQVLIVTVFVIYGFITLLPFYFLIIRTFVPTKLSTELWFWLPPHEEVDLNAGIGNLSIFWNLNIEQFKDDFGIEGYLKPSWTLNRISEEFGIPKDDLRAYFRPFTRFNGWMTLARHKLFLPTLARTTLLTVVGVVGLNVVSICTGTALAGLRHKYQMRIYNLYMLDVIVPPFLILLLYMLDVIVPPFLILLPQFYFIQRITGLIPGYEVPDSETRRLVELLTLSLMYIRGGSFSTMLFTSFITSIPRELEESAEIEGASRWQYMLRIQLPLLKVPIASLTVVALPWFWNDFLQPFVFLGPRNTTLLVLINSFIGQYSQNYQVIYSGVVLAVLPLMIIYFLFRRLFIQGVMAGAIKG
jgi:ABC-type glycerol-3-phosphate transport system permease component